MIELLIILCMRRRKGQNMRLVVDLSIQTHCRREVALDKLEA
jgi:hypothetical protein